MKGQETEQRRATPSDTAAEAARIVISGACMICCSAGVINFNKYLMAGPFPYATYLVLGHMGFGSCLSIALMTCVPSLYPSLTDPHKKVDVSLELVLTKALPIALFFAGSLVLSNMAYLYANVAFLQMMKQANVVLVYIASLVVGLELFRVRNIGVLCFILVGTSLNIAGEMKLSLIGVLLQASSQFFEVSRLILQSMLLSGQGIKLDVLTYNLVVMPLCFVALASFISIEAMFPDKFAVGLKAPSWEEVAQHKYLLLANMLLAFVLNLAIALFIKFSSAISMVLANVLKDIMVVLTSVVLLNEVVSMWQMIGFGVQILGVFTWSMMKTFPKKFEHGLIFGFVDIFMEGSSYASSAQLVAPPKASGREQMGRSPSQNSMQMDNDQGYGGTTNAASPEENLRPPATYKGDSGGSWSA